MAFDIAGKRNGEVCSIDKANVLDVSQLWKEVVIEEAKAYPDIKLSHMYVTIDEQMKSLTVYPRGILINHD